MRLLVSASAVVSTGVSVRESVGPSTILIGTRRRLGFDAGGGGEEVDVEVEASGGVGTSNGLCFHAALVRRSVSGPCAAARTGRGALCTFNATSTFPSSTFAALFAGSSCIARRKSASYRWLRMFGLTCACDGGDAPSLASTSFCNPTLACPRRNSALIFRGSRANTRLQSRSASSFLFTQ